MRPIPVRRLLPTLCLLLIVSPAAFAATYVVRPDGTGDFPDIQAAIDAVQGGDTIELTDGVFTGDGNRDIDYLGKAIIVTSAGGDPASCVIDCEGHAGDPHRGLLFVSAESPASVLEGITIRGAYADSCGAVLCRGASPALRRCVFSRNTVTGHGGALGCTDGASPDVLECRFELNHAGGNGGALYCRFEADPRVVDCVFESNTSGTHGGAIHSRGTEPSFVGCLLSNNSTAFLGGAVQNIGGAPGFTGCHFEGNQTAGHAGAFHSQYGAPSLTDCVFRANQAGESGGAMLVTLPSTPLVVRCRFESNTCGQFGGAIVSRHEAEPLLVDCTIVDNSALWYGGALYLYDGGRLTATGCLVARNVAQLGPGGAVSAGMSSQVGLTGCTLDANTAGDAGRAIRVSESSHVELQNCIVSHGGAGLVVCDGGGTAVLACTDLFGSGGDEWVGCLAGQGGTSGNLSADPLFCDAAAGDWSIDEASPCAPAGSGGCGLIGALPVGCGATAATPTTWGAIKASFTRRRGSP